MTASISFAEFLSDVLKEPVGDRRVVANLETHLVVGLEVMHLLGLDSRLNHAVKVLEIMLGSAQVMLNNILSRLLELADTQEGVQILDCATTLNGLSRYLNDAVYSHPEKIEVVLGMFEYCFELVDPFCHDAVA